MRFLIITAVLVLLAAPARADNVVYAYCWARGEDASDLTHEFVTAVVQIFNSRRTLVKEATARAIDGSRFQKVSVECEASVDNLEIQQRHQREWERKLFAFEQSPESVAPPEKVAINLESVRSASSDVARFEAGSSTTRAARSAVSNVVGCAEYIEEVDGGVASIRNHCRQPIWVTYCYYHPLPDTAASRIDCAKGSFGGAGPLAEGASDNIPPGNGALAILLPCPYAVALVDLGKGIGKLVAVTPASHYRCGRM